MSNIRVMIVDNQPRARRDLRIFLHSCDGLEFAGEANTTTEAVIMCGSIQPDVILVSMTASESSAISAIRILRHHYPSTRTVVLSSVRDNSLMAQALHAGAAHYIPRHPSRDILIDAIHYAVKQ
jgi:DNA-binding NarL/FixJ family response regulator